MAKKIFIGKVTSDKMMGTVMVAIERKVAHPRYGKLLKRTQKLMADTSSFREGKNGVEVKTLDMVVIEEIKPMSKNKNFKVIKVIKKEGARK